MLEKDKAFVAFGVNQVRNVVGFGRKEKIMDTKKCAFVMSLVLSSIMFLTITVWAIPMSFTLTGVGDTNNTASVIFAYDSANYKISLDLSNSSVLYDPRLTSFAFNSPTKVTGIDTFTSSNDGWSYSYSPGNINTPGQFGLFDIAGLTGPDFNGGSPNDGIPRGQTFSFSFTLQGTDLGSLSEMSFLSLLSDLGQRGNPDPQYFIGRFQQTGQDGEGSDVATPSNLVPVPEPGTMVLLGAGLLGLAIFGKRRMNNA